MRTPKSVLTNEFGDSTFNSMRKGGSTMVRSSHRSSIQGAEDTKSTTMNQEIDVNTMYALIDLNRETN